MQLINNTSNLSLDEAISKLSKSVYLESPDTWIILNDKVNDMIFDEMVLFFAIKYNIIEVLKYAIENNLINLNLASKDKAYENIGQRLIFTALQSNHTNIHNYLKNILGQDNNENTNTLIDSKNEKSTSYAPEFLCPKCNTNIFNSGYMIYENITYKFDSNTNKLSEVSRNLLDSIICSNCNTKIENASINQLENLCSIQNCNKCFADLTSVGIIDKSKMIFNKEFNKFNSTSASFHCFNCDNLINQSQKDYFGL